MANEFPTEGIVVLKVDVGFIADYLKSPWFFANYNASMVRL